MASGSSTCITSSEGPESIGINWEQAQQESASILNDWGHQCRPADICPLANHW